MTRSRTHPGMYLAHGFRGHPGTLRSSAPPRKETEEAGTVPGSSRQVVRCPWTSQRAPLGPSAPRGSQLWTDAVQLGGGGRGD